MCFDYSNKSKHEQDKLHWLPFHVPALQFSLQISSLCGIWAPVPESDVFLIISNEAVFFDLHAPATFTQPFRSHGFTKLIHHCETL
jgi:hypothetical protein